MKKLLACLTAAAMLASTAAFAATPTAAPTPPAPPADRTTPVQMTLTDLQVAVIAIANAGQACDQNVAAICQIVTVRAGTLAKLQAALQAIQAPALVPAAPAKK